MLISELCAASFTRLAVRLNLTLICLAWGALAGCASVKPASLPRDVPAAFENAVSAQPVQWPAQEWYRDFSSDELNGFVDLAVKDNSDLAVARARVAQADARARQAGSALLPSIDAAGNANYLAGHSSQGGGHELDWSGMLTASYEVDFWGKNRAAALSARLLAGASRAERERQTVAQSNSDAAKQLLEVVQFRFDAGVASPVELASEQTAYDAAQIA